MRKRTTEVDGQVGASSDDGTGTRRAAKEAKRAGKQAEQAGDQGEQAKQGKAQTKAAKQRAKEAKQQTKQAKQQAKAVQSGEHGKLTPGNAKKIVGIVTVVGPAVAPFAGRAAVMAREGYDRMRAHRLGVGVDELGRFSGKSAGLHARIAGDANALADLRARTAGRTDEDNRTAERFADTAEHRLGELTSAVRATERMPPARRRAAHHAVEGELDRIEDDLLRRFGIGA